MDFTGKMMFVEILIHMKHVLINNLKQNITFYIDMKDINILYFQISLPSFPHCPQVMRLFSLTIPYIHSYLDSGIVFLHFYNIEANVLNK